MRRAAGHRYLSRMSDPSPGRSRGHCLDDNELFDLAGGRLKETDLVLFEAHLDRCPACRRVVAAVARREARPPLVFDAQLLCGR